MTILGADPDQLEATASRVLAQADNYDSACNQVAHWLRRMDWQGPEADRFRAVFESQMRPQLDDAAAFLRQAASELRAQATAQTKASGTLIDQNSIQQLIDALAIGGLASGGGIASNESLSSWLKALLEITMPKVAPIGSQLFELSGLSGLADLFGPIGVASDLVGVGTLLQLHRAGELPHMFGKLPKFGLERLIGGATGTAIGGVMSGLGAVTGLVSLPGHANEFWDAWDKMHDSRHIQPEDMADTLDAFADMVFDTAGMVGAKFPPAALALGAFAGGMKLGANLDTPIIWACDNVIYPGWQQGKELFWDAVGGAEALGGAVLDGAEALGGAVLDGAEALGGAVFGGAEALGGAVFGGAEALGGAVLDGAEALGGAVLDGAEDLGDAVFGFFNPFD